MTQPRDTVTIECKWEENFQKVLEKVKDWEAVNVKPWPKPSEECEYDFYAPQLTAVGTTVMSGGNQSGKSIPVNGWFSWDPCEPPTQQEMAASALSATALRVDAEEKCREYLRADWAYCIGGPVHGCQVPKGKGSFRLLHEHTPPIPGGWDPPTAAYNPPEIRQVVYDEHAIPLAKVSLPGDPLATIYVVADGWPGNDRVEYALEELLGVKV